METGLTTIEAGAIRSNAAEITEELGRRFVEYIDATPTTAAAYTASIRQMVEYFHSNNITRPDRLDMVHYRDALREKYKPATVALRITAARLFFRWASQEGLYPNICDHLKPGKVDQGFKKDYLTASQALATINTAAGEGMTAKRDYALLFLMFSTGIRCIEAVRANIGDLGTVGGSAVLYVQGKGCSDKTKYVKIEPPVDRAIREYLLMRRKRYAHAPLFASNSNHNRDERMTPRSLERVIKNHLRAAGFDSERITPHSLRHTAATLNLLNGGSTNETRQMLRHKSPVTTELYTHNLERMANHSEARIVAAILNADNGEGAK